MKEVTIGDRAFSKSGIEAFLPSGSSLVIDGNREKVQQMFKRSSEIVKQRLLPSCGFESSFLRKIVIWQGIETIGPLCFQCCRHLCEITFEHGSNLKEIGSRAFSESGLRSLILPRSVEFIGPHCFAQCPHLTDLSFESKSLLQQICDFAYMSQSLISICLPAGVSSIAGSSLVTLSSVSIEEGSAHLSVDSSFLYDMRCATIIRYFGVLEVISIATGVEIVGESSFCDSKVRQVHISKSVRILGEYCFSRCEFLECIQFERDSQLCRIESYIYAFAWSSLKSISIPASIEFIAGTAFLDVPSIRFESTESLQCHDQVIYNNDRSVLVSSGSRASEMIICRGIVQLSPFGFASRTALRFIRFEFPCSLRMIGPHCFESSSLESIEIPRSVEYIRDFAFFECRQLRQLIFEEESRLVSIGVSAFSRSNVANVTFPCNLNSLGAFAFNDCFGVICVSFSKCERLEKLDSNTFDRTSVQSVVLSSSLETIGSNCYRLCRSL
jgi:hypothetical protein